jgi:uncharacterized OB-fold protein
MEPIQEGLFETRENGTGYLLTNKCERCGTSYFPRREKCTVCLKSDKLIQTKLAKTGKLYTYTALYRTSEKFKVPLLLGYVDFKDEGIRVFAQLEGCRAEDLQIGMDMELIFGGMNVVESEKNNLVYKFRPANQVNK